MNPIDCTAAKAAFVPLTATDSKQNLQQLHWSTSTGQNPQVKMAEKILLSKTATP